MNLDLPKSGKLIFETTIREIDIESWCKECQIVKRRFLELRESSFFLIGIQLRRYLRVSSLFWES